MEVVASYGNEFDITNASTAVHRIARWQRDAPKAHLFSDERFAIALSLFVGKQLSLYDFSNVIQHEI